MMKLKSGEDYIDEFKIAWAGRLKLPLFSYLTGCYVMKLFIERDEEIFRNKGDVWRFLPLTAGWRSLLCDEAS